MAELVRAAELRALEQAAIAAGTTTGLELMERAAEGAVAAALARWPQLAAGPARAVVLCGPGNNGGDGLAVARLLAGRGWQVSVLLAADPARLPPDAHTNLERLPPSVRLHTVPPGEPLDAALIWLATELDLPAGCGTEGATGSPGNADTVADEMPNAGGSATSQAARQRREIAEPESAGADPDFPRLRGAAATEASESAEPVAANSALQGSQPATVRPVGRTAAEPGGASSLAEGSAPSEVSAVPSCPGSAPLLLVDALFGTGLGRPALAVAPLLRLANAATALRLAVDLPSGICADSGRLLQPASGGCVALQAALTVTFHRAKPGHFLAEGAAARGELVAADIGLVAAPDRPLLRSAEPPDRALLDKGRLPLGRAHKFGHGHALVLAGGPGRGGAARLAARAALRTGAGLVTLAPPPAALPENAGRLEAVMLVPLADAAALRERLTDPRLTALCLGPGLDTGAREAGLLAAALAAACEPGRSRRLGLVLDADALTLLARPRATCGATWLAQAAPLGTDAVLTPHMGEFGRLFPDLAARLAQPPERGPAFSKLDAAREAAARAGCVVLLKGVDTVIAEPGGAAVLHAATADRAAPWLATAGAGDVLAGIIAGLLARGLPAFEAAEAAVWLHVEAARRFGPGLIAEDLPETLPGVFRALGQ